MKFKKKVGEDMSNWKRAKHEMSYIIKEEAHVLENKGEDSRVAIKKAEKKVKESIKLRAFLIYRATNDFNLDNWLKAETECQNRADFFKNVKKCEKNLKNC